MKIPIRKAVILAGGLGMRLQPLTHIIPKPLLPIGESTILEIQILALKKQNLKIMKNQKFMLRLKFRLM